MLVKVLVSGIFSLCLQTERLGRLVVLNMSLGSSKVLLNLLCVVCVLCGHYTLAYVLACSLIEVKYLEGSSIPVSPWGFRGVTVYGGLLVYTLQCLWLKLMN